MVPERLGVDFDLLARFSQSVVATCWESRLHPFRNLSLEYEQRLLLEARGQSDIGRHDLALDIIANIVGREAIRLRSDIRWAARRI